MKILTYQSMTLVQWQQLICTLKYIFSITITTTTGCSSKWGFGLQWCYEEAVQTLSLLCIKKPYWASELLLEIKIDELIRKALASQQPTNE